MKDDEFNQNLSLLKKLKSKLTPAKIAKSIAGLAIATTMLFTTFACTNSNSTTNSSTGSSTGNSTNQEQSSTNSENKKYSKLITNILDNTYYNQLLSMAKDDETFYASAYFDPHPYAFLEDEGFDTEAIKAGETFCRTQSFVKDEEPRNLYIATYVENKAGNYYHQYMLKYTLTEQEMKDYDMLHYHDGGKFYVQAVFANNEISKMKEPEIVSETKINKDTHKEFTKYCDKISVNIGSDFNDVILKGFDTQKNEFKITVIPYYTNSNSMRDSSSNIINATYFACSQIGSNSKIFFSPSNIDICNILSNTKENTTFYYGQKTNLTYINGKIL